jgi:hypothetical protein
MIYTSRIIFRIFCLSLMLHTLALNICDDLYLKWLGQSSKIMVLKNVDVEEESDAESKTTKSDDVDSLYDDDYFFNTSSFISDYNKDDDTGLTTKFRFYFSFIILAPLHYEIQIPPPRTTVNMLLS